MNTSFLPDWPWQINAIPETIGPIATGYASKRSGEVRKDLKAEH